MSQNEPTAAAAKPARDVRVDPVGFAGELVKLLANDLRTAVKLKMTRDGLERVQGDAFEGLLYSTSSGTIRPAAWLDLYEQNVISREAYLSATSVGNTAAKKVMGENAIAGMSDFASSVALKVERIEGVEPTLLDAVNHLRPLAKAASVKPKPRR